MTTTPKTVKLDRDAFEASIIAQHDDEDYDESGYVAFVVGKTAYIARYSHCSCFGTWTALDRSDHSIRGGGNLIYEWSGTVIQLISMARKKMDPALTGRVASPEDNDYDHLMAVYEQVIEWDKRGRRGHSTRS